MSQSLFAVTVEAVMDLDVYLCSCSNVERLHVWIRKKELELCKKSPRNTDGEEKQRKRQHSPFTWPDLATRQEDTDRLYRASPSAVIIRRSTTNGEHKTHLVKSSTRVVSS